MVTQRGRGEGWTGGFVLACAHCGIWNDDWSMGTCCRAQGTSTQYSVIIYMGKESEREQMCVYV